MDRDAILRKYPPQSENLLALLHDLQDARELHYLTEEDLWAAADQRAPVVCLPYCLSSFRV